jgi:Sec7-like guanine-nucleotide exchange factor
VLLPKEAQQIDRAMEDFAKRYHECNPGLVDHPGNK